MKNTLFIRLKSFKVTDFKYILTGLAALCGSTAVAQTPEAVQTVSPLSLFANPLFDVLLGVILFLIIVIAILGGVLKSVAEVSEKKNNTTVKTIVAIISFLLFASSPQSAMAQSRTEAIQLSSYIQLPDGIFYLMLIVIAFEILIIGMLMNSIKIFTRKKIDESVVLKEEPSFFEVLNASVAIENESEILMDHEYDGIRELDNDLPPWWKYGFYITIVGAVIYLFNYHVIGGGLLQKEEYNASMYMAKVAKEEYQKMNANSVNESTVTVLTDKAEIAKGETIFKENCFACHGKFGEGGVGPNLTDNYWLHGGSIKDVFVSVKYGWPDKGMKSWEADFSPIQIHQISSYIKTLKGTNPPNPKAPQGNLYEEQLIAGDSIKTADAKVDSLKMAIKQ